jgi:hypothetical protein
VPSRGSPDDPFGGQALEGRGRPQTDDPGDRQPALGNDKFLALTGSVEPFTQARSQVTDGNVHA